MADKQKYILAIDLGTGGPKASLVGLDGKIAATQSKSIDVQFVGSNGVEQDPELIWGAVKSVCRDVIAVASVPPELIIGLICCSQYSSVVPVDSSGNPLMNFILWMDTRGGKYNTALHREQPDALQTWADIHGLPPMEEGNDSLAHMLWIKNERPDIYEQTSKFLEPADYINLRFTGRACANQCTAFSMLLTDNRNLDEVNYDSELVSRSKIEFTKLPELVPLGTQIGKVLPSVAQEIGLLPSTVVFTALNDTQAAAVSTGAFQDGHATLCIGSSAVILARIDAKAADFDHMIYCMPGAIPGEGYVVMAENGLAGKVVEHFLKSICFYGEESKDGTDFDLYAPLHDLVDSSLPGSDGLLFLPWLGGSLAPSPDEKMRGGFLNMSMNTTRAHMARAVLEGVAFNLRRLLPHVESFTGKTFESLKFSGGGALSSQWAQILADVLGRQIHQMKEPRAVNTRGIALLAFHNIGLITQEELTSHCPVERVFSPRSEYLGVYDRLFRQFVLAYQNNKSIFSSLLQQETPCVDPQ